MGLFEAACRFLRFSPKSPKSPSESEPEHIFWVLPNVLAGRPGPVCEPWTLAELLNENIGGIISLDGPIRLKELSQAGIEHLPVYQPMLLLYTREDHLRFLKVMPQVIEFIDRMRKTGRATLVHCYHGCDRTGSAIACYLVAREGMTASKAINAVQLVKPDAMWAVGYMEVVRTFESIYNERPEPFEESRVT